MSTYSPQHPNNNDNNISKHIFLLIFIAMNALSTSNLIRTGHDITKGATDKNQIVGLMLWLGCTIYTAMRAIEIYKDIYNNQDKQK